MTLPDRLRRAREVAGLSQRELSALAKLSPGAVWFLEREPNRETASWIHAGLADALGVSLDWLVRGVGPEPEPEAIRAAVEAARARLAAATAGGPEAA